MSGAESACWVSGKAENRADALWRLLGYRQALPEGTCSFWAASGIAYSLLAQGETLGKNISHVLYFQTSLLRGMAGAAVTLSSDTEQ